MRFQKGNVCPLRIQGQRVVSVEEFQSYVRSQRGLCVEDLRLETIAF